MDKLTENPTLQNIFNKIAAVATPKEIISDINYLDAVGHWKDRTAPKWAEVIVESLHCNLGSGAVTSTAWEYVARYAMNELDYREYVAAKMAGELD